MPLCFADYYIASIFPASIPSCLLLIALLSFLNASNLFRFELGTLFVSVNMRLVSLLYIWILNVATGIAWPHHEPSSGNLESSVRKRSNNNQCGFLNGVDRGNCDPNVNSNYRCCGPKNTCGELRQDPQSFPQRSENTEKITGIGDAYCKEGCQEYYGICEADHQGMSSGRLCGIVDGINRGFCNIEVGIDYKCCGKKNTCGES